MPVWIEWIHWFSRLVLVVLFFLSVFSIATIIQCIQNINSATGKKGQPTRDFNNFHLWIKEGKVALLEKWSSEEKTLLARTSQNLLSQSRLGALEMDRAIRSELSIERTKLEQGLTVLATLGSNSPFIGLFGTVLGIIEAFGALGSHQNNTADIMTGVSEALFATAVGLFVAIPAVIAFNYFSRKIRILLTTAEAMKDFYLSQRPNLAQEKA